MVQEIITIRTAPDIEDIVKGYANLDSDEKRGKIVVEGNILAPLEDVFRGFEQALKAKGSTGDRRMKEINAIKLPVLTPEQISLFLIGSVKYEDKFFYVPNTGYFLTRLMQDSYREGYNGFYLNTKGLAETITNVGYGLVGDEKRMMELRIEGSIGDSCFNDAKSVRAKAMKMGDNCLYGAESVQVDAETIGDSIGMNGKSLTINAKEIGGYCCHRSHDSAIRADKIGKYCATASRNADVEAAIILDGCGNDAHDGRFITSGETALKRLRKSVMKETGNTIGFRGKDGRLTEWKL